MLFEKELIRKNKLTQQDNEVILQFAALSVRKSEIFFQFAKIVNFYFQFATLSVGLRPG